MIAGSVTRVLIHNVSFDLNYGILWCSGVEIRPAAYTVRPPELLNDCIIRSARSQSVACRGPGAARRTCSLSNLFAKVCKISGFLKCK